jgi:hypothetical protein
MDRNILAAVIRKPNIFDAIHSVAVMVVWFAKCGVGTVYEVSPEEGEGNGRMEFQGHNASFDVPGY